MTGAPRPSAPFFTRRLTVLRAPSLQSGVPGDYAVDDSAGRGEAPAPVPGLAALPASVQPAAGRAAQSFGQRVLDVDTEVYFARDVDVRRDDVLRDDASGVTYLVGAAGDEAQQGRVSWVLAKRYR